MSGARILVITGPGKGKTTAALGMILRAHAHGRTVLLARFCKNSFSGELAVLGKLPGVTIRNSECGMTPPPDHPDFARHLQCARDLFAWAVENAPEFDTVVLDELCGAVAKDLVPEGDVVEFLGRLRPEQAAVLTGRGATPGLIDAADTVSDIHCVKHGYQQGIAAQEGIER